MLKLIYKQHMNKYFSLRRFMMLLKSHWAEYRKRYALFTLAMFCVMLFGAICILIVTPELYKDESQYALYIFSYFVVGVIFSGTFLNAMNDKSKGITYLLTPASSFEKLLCALLFTLPILFIVFTIAFYIIDIPIVKLSNMIRYENYLRDKALNISNSYYYNQKFEPYKIITFCFSYGRERETYDIIKHILWIGLGLQAFFLAGSAYFKRFSFVKTLLASFLTFLFFMVFMYVITRVFSGTSDRLLSNYFSDKPVLNSYYYIMGAIIWYFKLGMALCLYALTYIHIKEKQI